MAESSNSNPETELTMCDVLQEEQELEDDANAVLGGSDDTNCSYDQGYVPRQALYACKTCSITGEAGVCLACCYACHDGHEVVELYTKRNFRCDCGNSKFDDTTCKLTSKKDPLNSRNKYNHNFKGLYCSCSRPYPDLEDDIPDEMIQCVFCEDWYHGRHLGVSVPEDYFEMICERCMQSHKFLYSYLDKYNVIVDVCGTPKKESKNSKSPAKGKSPNKKTLVSPGKNTPKTEVDAKLIDVKAESGAEVVAKPINVKAENGTEVDAKPINVKAESGAEVDAKSKDIKVENCPEDPTANGSNGEAPVNNITTIEVAIKSEDKRISEPDSINSVQVANRSLNSAKNENGETPMEVDTKPEVKTEAPVSVKEEPMQNGDAKDVCVLKNLSDQPTSTGSAFWSENWRKELCRCSKCMTMYVENECEFLLNPNDTIQAYEERGKNRPSQSQYDKGLDALSQLDRVKQMEAVRAYTSMKGELKEYLKEFADNKRTVCESDIKQFFERMSKKQKLSNGVPHFCR